MSDVLNDPADFADECAAGSVAVHRALVRRVTGGVARALATPPGEVALDIGGGLGSANSGLLSTLGDRGDGLILDRFAHDPEAFANIIDEAAGIR